MTVRKDPVTVRKSHVVRYPGRLMKNQIIKNKIFLKIRKNILSVCYGKLSLLAKVCMQNSEMIFKNPQKSCEKSANFFFVRK